MINAISSVSFQSRFGKYSSHTPKMRPYREFEFMPELQDKNPIKNFFKKMVEEYKAIREAMKLNKK